MELAPGGLRGWGGVGDGVPLCPLLAWFLPCGEPEDPVCVPEGEGRRRWAPPQRAWWQRLARASRPGLLVERWAELGLPAASRGGLSTFLAG